MRPAPPGTSGGNPSLLLSKACWRRRRTRKRRRKKRNEAKQSEAKRTPESLALLWGARPCRSGRG
eukprot:9309543-Pyramimonas_sp.AAC.1